MSDNDEYVAICQRIERARLSLNATPWYRPFKRQEAAMEYRHALLAGAFWEIDHGMLEE